MANVVAIIIIITLTIFAIFVIPTLMTRRAIHLVIKIFRHHGALNAETAKTVDELRLTPPSLQQRLFKTRDYKPRALENLKENGVVRTTEDDRLFFSEGELTLMLRKESGDTN